MRYNRLIITVTNVVLLAVTILTISNCAAPKTTTTSQGGKYSEDLSAWRPKTQTPVESTTTGNPGDERKPVAYVEPKLTVNEPLDNVLDSIDHINLSKKYVEGFTIQVYSGKREEALNAKKQLATSLPKLDCDIQFTEPIFRVKVGKYHSRLEAQEDYMAVKRYFPAAIIIPERLAVN
ncbi:MAG TPA: SPOR domain-containing protein [Ohtaekwangia sp.]